MCNDFLTSLNIPIPQKPITHNGFTRWGGKNNNRYSARLIGDGIYIKDFATDLDETWFPKSNNSLSEGELQKRKEEIAKAKKGAEEVLKNQHEATAQKTVDDWNKLLERGRSPYLESKQVKAYGVRHGKTGIAVPMRDIEGKLWNYEKIPHNGGVKKGLYQGRRKGLFHLIGDLENSDTIFIVEGYSTGATVYEATGIATVIAFTAGNLEPVISSIKSKYPDISITIAADNDQWKEVNTGKIKAEEAAKKHGCNVIFPAFIDTIKKGGSNAGN